MKLTRIAQLGAIGAIAALTLTACAANEGGTPPSSSGASTGAPATKLKGQVAGTGASSQEVAIQAWTAAFQGSNPDVTITYDAAGSGAGRTAFAEGGVAFAGSDRAFKPEELTGGAKALAFKGCADGSGLVELPTYISPIAVIFNVQGVDKLNLDADTTAKLFSGAITTWNDPAIAALNPGVTLPDTKVNPVHRSDDSGTTENFTQYLNAVAPTVWTNKPDGKWPLQSGEAANGTSGVVDTVKNGAGTIGYADASRAHSAGLKSAAIKVGAKFVEYTPEAAATVVEASPFETGRGKGDLAISLDRKTEKDGAYPIVLVSYLIACEKYAPEFADKAPIIKEYFKYIASEAGQSAAAKAAGSAPITSALREKINSAIELIGTK